MRRRPPRSTRTDTLFPYTTLFRSNAGCAAWQGFRAYSWAAPARSGYRSIPHRHEFGERPHTRDPGADMRIEPEIEPAFARDLSVGEQRDDGEAGRLPDEPVVERAENGRASGRERGRTNVYISVVA